MRTTVTDVWGAGWKGRARPVRGAGTAPPHPGPDAARLQSRLAAALGRYPAPLVASAPLDVRLAAAPISDPVDREVSDFRGNWDRPGTSLWVLFEAGPALVRRAFAGRRGSGTETWEVELVARGRFRHWARWQVSGSETAARVLAEVTADLGAGRTPDPSGAALVEVVDHRPPYRPRPGR